MSPIAIQIGAFTVRWYGVMAAVGFLAAAFFINWNRKEAKLTSDQASNLVFIAMTAGVVGARIFYVVQFASQFRNNWFDVVRIDKCDPIEWLYHAYIKDPNKRFKKWWYKKG